MTDDGVFGEEFFMELLMFKGMMLLLSLLSFDLRSFGIMKVVMVVGVLGFCI